MPPGLFLWLFLRLFPHSPFQLARHLIDMNEMNSSDFEALLTAQRSAMIRDIPTSSAGASGETPTLTKAELAELLFDNVGLNKLESWHYVAP